MYGSLVNYVFSNSNSPAPEVGMGGTVLSWSDRAPVTIVGVEYFKSGAKAGQVKAVKVQADKAVRTDSNGLSESQSYDYVPQPDAPVVTFKLYKTGKFQQYPGGPSLRIGSREKYYDYSF